MTFLKQWRSRFLVLLLSLTLPAGALALPFKVGERLIYTLVYLGVDAGTATMEVREVGKQHGRSAYHIVSTAQSSDFTSLFYPVDDRIESYLDVEGLYSHYIMVRQHEGRRRRHKTVEFDQVKRQAVQWKDNQQKTFEIPHGVQDALSSLYFFRTQPLPEVGKSIVIDVHEGEKNWKVELIAAGKETLETPVGTFDTTKVKTTLGYEGIILTKGEMFIWFSNDARHIPVMIKTKIKIGSIVAYLTSMRTEPMGTGSPKKDG